MEVILNLQTVSKTHEQRSLWLMGSQLLFYNKALANSVQGSIGFQTFNHPKNLNIFWTFIVSSSLNVSFPLWTWSHADQYCFSFLSFLSSCHAEKDSSNQRQRLQVGTAQVRGYPPPHSAVHPRTEGFICFFVASSPSPLSAFRASSDLQCLPRDRRSYFWVLYKFCKFTQAQSK